MWNIRQQNAIKVVNYLQLNNEERHLQTGVLDTEEKKRQ